MKFPMALLVAVAVGLLGLACSNEPVTREPEPPFGMFLGAWSAVPAGSIANL